MLAWLKLNIATIIISLILIAVVAAVIVSIVKNKKKGKSSCGCNCAHCAMAGSPQKIVLLREAPNIRRLPVFKRKSKRKLTQKEND